jgi:glycosyltransferase involved in cell wall biosynthesis
VNLLENVDFLATEGKRDRFIAASLGYDKSFFRDKPVSRCPSSVSKYLINNNLPSGRKKIAVKGYSNKFGKGEIALDALERLLKTDMKRYEIAVFSAEGRALKKANQMKKAGFQIVIHKKFSLSQGQVIQLLSESRLYVGLSRSDGLPASFIEALAVGTFPVQTDTSLAGDWIQDGKTGYIVSLDDPQNIELCLLRALENDNLVDEAAEKNIKLVSSKADRKAHEQLLRNELASFLNS